MTSLTDRPREPKPLPPGDTGGSGSTLRVLFLNWRDSTHPEGGGSEEYVERVAERLIRDGHQVTLFCADHGRAPRDETVPTGVRVIRRGGRFSVYAHALARLGFGRLPAHDVIVDVQNGVPFWSSVAGSAPVVVLCHHVHREQWRVVLPPRQAAFGWWLESRVAPWVQRGCRYVTVSQSSHDELVSLGVDPGRITVVHNGVDPAPQPDLPRSGTPELVVLGRLVPHKRVELALQAVADLRARHPDVRLTVVGQGYWEKSLRAEADRLGISDRVMFTGFVDDRRKAEILSRAWVLAMPSLKEGWGITVMEAASHGTPAVGFRQAGGISESILHGRTGLLCEDVDGFVAALDRLLTDAALRGDLGERARCRSHEFSWEATAAQFTAVLEAVVSHRRAGGAMEPGVEPVGEGGPQRSP